jgi:hypothetical protein
MGYRQLTMGDETWHYKVGKRHVSIKSPDGKHYTPTCGEVAGIDDWERARYKRYGHITPALVINWIGYQIESEYKK